MTDAFMDRETAHAFARHKCLKDTTYRHLISVEGVMRALARRLGEDQELWGLTGLFHDLDQDHTGDEGARHEGARDAQPRTVLRPDRRSPARRAPEDVAVTATEDRVERLRS